MIMQLVAAFVVSALVTALVGLWLVPVLRRIKAGQMIREDGPVWHNNKQGTPTMGGIMFIVGILASILAVGIPSKLRGDFSHILIFNFALVYGLIGFIDDYQKLKRKQNLGLRAKHKFGFQLLMAVIFLFLLRQAGYLSTELYIPFVNTNINIPTIPYFIFAAFVVVGTVNAVNITDGADGLATGVSIPVTACLTSIAVLWNFLESGIFAAAMTGGLAAFLFFNFHPAKVFMGDIGAQFIGGAIAAIAFVMDMPLILLPLGFVFFVETMSDIIQVTYFRLTKGKRIFKMAPLHHHFEMLGWSEYKLFTVFTAVSLLFSVISFLGVFNRF
jgi:phospho-N-acetylmuramoyl-pentapeptide-transferase